MQIIPTIYTATRKGMQSGIIVTKWLNSFKIMTSRHRWAIKIKQFIYINVNKFMLYFVNHY